MQDVGGNHAPPLSAAVTGLEGQRSRERINAREVAIDIPQEFDAMVGVQWEAHIIAEARETARRASSADFPVELICAPGIYVTMIDDPRILAGSAFELERGTLKLGPMLIRAESDAGMELLAGRSEIHCGPYLVSA